MRRHFFKLVSFFILIVATIALPVAPVNAEPGSCIDDRGCTNISVNGTGQSYRFASDDSNLDNNYYGSESFPRGESVNDSVSSVRNRRSTATRFCAYQNGNFSGSVYGDAPYSGATWVNTTNAASSSVRFRNSAC